MVAFVHLNSNKPTMETKNQAAYDHLIIAKYLWKKEKFYVIGSICILNKIESIIIHFVASLTMTAL